MVGTLVEMGSASATVRGGERDGADVAVANETRERALGKYSSTPEAKSPWGSSGFAKSRTASPSVLSSVTCGSGAEIVGGAGGWRPRLGKLGDKQLGCSVVGGEEEGRGCEVPPALVGALPVRPGLVAPLALGWLAEKARTRRGGLCSAAGVGGTEGRGGGNEMFVASCPIEAWWREVEAGDVGDGAVRVAEKRGGEGCAGRQLPAA
jgi:hypothetical protein